jgi:hypothetical protein
MELIAGCPRFAAFSRPLPPTPLSLEPAFRRLEVRLPLPHERLRRSSRGCQAPRPPRHPGTMIGAIEPVIEPSMVPLSPPSGRTTAQGTIMGALWAPRSEARLRRRFLVHRYQGSISRIMAPSAAPTKIAICREESLKRWGPCPLGAAMESSACAFLERLSGTPEGAGGAAVDTSVTPFGHLSDSSQTA